MFIHVPFPCRTETSPVFFGAKVRFTRMLLPLYIRRSIRAPLDLRMVLFGGVYILKYDHSLFIVDVLGGSNTVILIRLYPVVQSPVQWSSWTRYNREQNLTGPVMSRWGLSVWELLSDFGILAGSSRETCKRMFKSCLISIIIFISSTYKRIHDIFHYHP